MNDESLCDKCKNLFRARDGLGSSVVKKCLVVNEVVEGHIIAACNHYDELLVESASTEALFEKLISNIKDAGKEAIQKAIEISKNEKKMHL